MRVLCSLLVMILALALCGCAVAPSGGVTQEPQATVTVEPTMTAPPPTMTATPRPSATPEPTLTPTASLEALKLSLPEGISLEGVAVGSALESLDLASAGYALEFVPASEANLTLSLRDGTEAIPPDAQLFGWRYYAAVVPFDTVDDLGSMADVYERWTKAAPGALLVDSDTAQVLEALWGPGQPRVVASEELAQALEEDRTALGVVPFEALDPTLKVLSIGTRSLFDAALQPADYPLALALILEGPGAQSVGSLLADAVRGWENRDPSRMTSLVMTGVTAMSRLTARQMETYGYEYPALVIGEELSQADITHVSNEVPFIDGCPVDTSEDNLTFCSDYEYWAALEAIGTDIVGLSGNHVNDFGYDGARESISFYRERGIPIYGSGMNVSEACAPMFYEHNGNRLAFVGALAYEPSWAWATDELPGACHYYDHKEALLQRVSELSADPEVDMVLVELQYLETYQPYPTDQQVAEFRELRAAGADVVTGVQSHVPQAWESYGEDDDNGSGIIVYGLGNLFFDQMWSWETRTALMARHTIYQGRLINSQVLTTVLEDYAQPRWAGADERAEILGRIFGAAPAR